MTLAQRWRDARVPVAGLHLDSAACSRQSHAVIEVAATHARHEAEVGGYVAAAAAEPALAAGRSALRTLAGLPDAQVVFTTGSGHALDTERLAGATEPGLPAGGVRTEPDGHGGQRL